MTDRYSVPWARALFGPEATHERWTRVSRAVLYHARADGLIPSDVQSGIFDGPVPADFEARVAAREAEVGHDVAAYLDVLRELAHHETAAWIHFGLTSSNLVDTGLVIALESAAARLWQQARVVEAELAGLAPVARASRTHGQRAEPSDLRTQARAWSMRFSYATQRLTAATSMLQTSLGGPTGRYETLPYETALRVADSLGVTLESCSEQAARRDRIAAWAQAVASLATAAAHLATQVRLGARDGELREPTGASAYRGSSSMAYKRNPTRSERIVGLERVVRALAGAVAEDAVWWDQRDITASSVERVALPQIVELTSYCLSESVSIVSGLEWDQAACDRSLEGLSGGGRLWDRVLLGASHEEAYEAARLADGP